MSLRERKLEEMFKKFLEKVYDILTKSPTEYQGFWIAYIPERDEVKKYVTRDEAIKDITKNENAKYIFLIQIPFETEESFRGFQRMISRIIGKELVLKKEEEE